MALCRPLQRCSNRLNFLESTHCQSVSLSSISWIRLVSHIVFQFTGICSTGDESTYPCNRQLVSRVSHASDYGRVSLSIHQQATSIWTPPYAEISCSTSPCLWGGQTYGSPETTSHSRHESSISAAQRCCTRDTRSFRGIRACKLSSIHEPRHCISSPSVSSWHQGAHVQQLIFDSAIQQQPFPHRQTLYWRRKHHQIHH